MWETSDGACGATLGVRASCRACAAATSAGALHPARVAGGVDAEPDGRLERSTLGASSTAVSPCGAGASACVPHDPCRHGAVCTLRGKAASLSLKWGRRVQAAKGSFLPFEEAREIVRKEGLKSQKQWQAWCRDAPRPSNIPSAPDVTYKGEWVSWPDWLGYRQRAVRQLGTSLSQLHTLYSRTSGAPAQEPT